VPDSLINLNLPTRLKLSALGDGDDRQRLELSAFDPATGRTEIAFIAGGDMYLLCPDGIRTDWNKEVSIRFEFVLRDLGKGSTT
jgi:hypothetical protein